MSDYWTPSHHAVEHDDAEALARWPAGGADPDEVFSNMTLLTHAIDAEGDGSLQSGEPLTVHITAVLLAFGADPELADPDGRTPPWTWPPTTVTTWRRVCCGPTSAGAPPVADESAGDAREGEEVLALRS